MKISNSIGFRPNEPDRQPSMVYFQPDSLWQSNASAKPPLGSPLQMATLCEGFTFRFGETDQTFGPFAPANRDAEGLRESPPKFINTTSRAKVL